MFKSNIKNQKNKIVNQKMKFISAEKQLDDKHYEFLKRVNKHKIDIEFSRIISLLGLSSTQTIESFISLELVKESDYKE